MIAYLLAAFGLAYIVGHSTISLPFRKWMGGTPERVLGDELSQPEVIPAVAGALGPFGDFITALIECPACFGFWIGLVTGLLGFVSPDGFVTLTGGWTNLTWPLLLACATSGSNFIIGRLTRLI